MTGIGIGRTALKASRKPITLGVLARAPAGSGCRFGLFNYRSSGKKPNSADLPESGRPVSGGRPARPLTDRDAPQPRPDINRSGNVSLTMAQGMKPLGTPLPPLLASPLIAPLPPPCLLTRS